MKQSLLVALIVAFAPTAFVHAGVGGSPVPPLPLPAKFKVVCEVDENAAAELYKLELSAGSVELDNFNLQMRLLAPHIDGTSNKPCHIEKELLPIPKSPF